MSYRVTSRTWSLASLLTLVVSLNLGCTPSEPAAEGPQFRVAEESPQAKSAPQTSVPAEKIASEPALEEEAGLTPPKRTQGEEQPGPVGGAGQRVLLKPPFDTLPAALQQKIGDWQKLSQAKPQGRTEREQIQSMMRIHREIVRLCDEIYSDEGLSAATDPKAVEALRNETLRARLDALNMLTRLQSPGAEEELKRTADILLKNPDREYAFMGRVTYLQFALQDIDKSNPTDGSPYLKEVESILQEWGDHPPSLFVCKNTADLLVDKKFFDAAADAYLLASAQFTANADPDIAMIARDVEMRGLSVLATQGRTERREGAKKKLLDLVIQLTQRKDPLEAALKSILETTLEFESTDIEFAEKIYARLDAEYGKHSDKELAINAGKAVQNGRKRMALVGKPFTVEGELPDGTPFDWKKYEGKVVLVDFWATWCDPCIREMSNILGEHRKFHELGFDVVGVSLDDELESVLQFSKQANLPWEIVVSADDAQRGFKHPLAVHCGVDSIPFVILVGRDGKVDGIHVRGERLGIRLAELLGEPKVPEAKPEAPAEKKPSGEAKPSEEKPASETAPATEKPAESATKGP